MASDERCDFSDLPKPMCDHCNPDGALNRFDYMRATGRKPVAEGGAFPAQFSGQCAGGCGLPINEGDFITAMSGGAGYAHEECVS